jgi:hypothetical protein
MQGDPRWTVRSPSGAAYGQLVPSLSSNVAALASTLPPAPTRKVPTAVTLPVAAPSTVPGS